MPTLLGQRLPRHQTRTFRSGYCERGKTEQQMRCDRLRTHTRQTEPSIQRSQPRRIPDARTIRWVFRQRDPSSRRPAETDRTAAVHDLHLPFATVTANCHRFRSRAFPNSLPTLKPIPASSTWLREVCGNSTHPAGELFKMMTGINMFHAPYRGSAPALSDLISGQVQVMFDLMASSIGYIRAGQLRALAVTAAQRSEALPELPTVGDFVPGYEASTVGGIGAPKRTPTAIVNKLNTEINAALADPNLRSRYAALGSEPHPMSPIEFGKVIAAETDKWGNVIRFAGIEPE